MLPIAAISFGVVITFYTLSLLSGRLLTFIISYPITNIPGRRPGRLTAIRYIEDWLPNFPEIFDTMA
jgi:hypothetical protein